jgi:hypothetical protein
MSQVQQARDSSGELPCALLQVNFFFYKNLIFGISIFTYNAFTLFSGQVRGWGRAAQLAVAARCISCSGAEHALPMHSDHLQRLLHDALQRHLHGAVAHRDRHL